MIREELKEYIEKTILPLYDSFDRAHNNEHVQKVIDNSMFFCSDFDVCTDMVYTIAAYHDVGLMYGRENHEKTSADFLMADICLNQWFSAEDITIMGEAVHDHRASNDYEPRSIYGKIVSEADRDIEYMTILTRTIYYSVEHFSEYTKQEHFDRTCEHIQDKYGENGYIKQWLDIEKNTNRLRELRTIMMDEQKVRDDFERIYAKVR